MKLKILKKSRKRMFIPEDKNIQTLDNPFKKCPSPLLWHYGTVIAPLNLFEDTEQGAGLSFKLIM